MINRRLYDLLARQAFYVENVKNFQKESFRKRLPELVKDLKSAFNDVPYSSLDDMTKKELNDFIKNVKDITKYFFSYWSEELVKEMNNFVKTDLHITKALIANYLVDNTRETEITDEEKINKIIQENEKEKDKNQIIPFAWIYENKTSNIYDMSEKTPIPANGILPDVYLASLSLTAVNRIKNTIFKGSANKESMEEILRDIVGTKDNNYKDGDFAFINRSAEVIIDTEIQHFSSIISAAVQSVVFEKYQWISIMDWRTSDICRYRNRRIYLYGKGPLPPAHAHCRSHTTPVIFGDVTPEETYFTWISNQPESIQVDLLGKNKAKKLQNGLLTATDLPKYNEISTLSVEEFGSKLNNILTR